MESATKPALEIKNLSVSFNSFGKKTKVLSALNYTLYAGQTLSVVGESGSGKTVHALSILGLLGDTAKVEGEIIFEGKNLLKLSSKQMRDIRGRRIAMIFQDPMTSLNPVLTIGNQIAETLLAHNQADKKTVESKVIDLLEQVEIKDGGAKYNSYPHEFSGGQRQRIMIAMALACAPDILIADEPTTALDVTIQKQIITLLKNLQTQRNMALIFITHNLALVSELGGNVLVLYAGQSAEESTANELFSKPLHPYSLGLIESAVPAKTGQNRLHAIEGAPPVAGEVFTGCPFEPRCKKRMPKCAASNPPVFTLNGRKTRCYLSEND
ncbi:oligopeptide/dipeptide ABC transporter ATP-binding protein [Elusimicrobium simillimum]|uniref:ABC transporter ATP-binding protein n=1 Tax=Elusimicrobium simillimum TaxID=3143438 RepID=UPI003C6F6D8C